MDTELLKTFLEVQRTRHFGKAAENLYLTQSAVSFRIRQLEQQLGVNLFVRYRNNIQLTAAGERLLPHAQTMLSALQRALQDVMQSTHQTKPLSLAAPSALWDGVLTGALLKIQRLQPTLSWQADSLSREATTRHLLEHQLDLAIVFDAPKAEEIMLNKIATISFLAVQNPLATITENMIDKHYCYIDWGNDFEIQHNRLFSEQMPFAYKSSNANLTLNWLLQYPGTAYLPAPMVQSHLEAGTLKSLGHAPVISCELYAAYLTDNQYDRELQAFISLLQQAINSQADVVG